MSGYRCTGQGTIRRFITYIIFVAVYFSPLVAEILPTQRITVWNPGISGGIPAIESPLLNIITDFNASNDSTTDAASAIQAALDSLKNTGGVVYIPPGTYRIDGAISFNGNNTILRGAGADKTRLYLGYLGNAFFVGMYGRGDWQSLQTAEKGEKTVTVTDGSRFSPGSFAEIQQTNNNELMITDPELEVDWAENMVGQFFEVVSVQGNEVTFKTPLHYQPAMDHSPQIRPQRLRQSIGIGGVRERGCNFANSFARHNLKIFPSHLICKFESVPNFQPKLCIGNLA